MSTIISPTTADDRAQNSTNTRWIGRTVIYGLLLIFAVLYLMPLFVMLTTSFKTMD
ncbi:carbohydrate ABC transporter permease, partial [Rhizobium laguerreae]|nr:carbohydrate ABC transporter permease [Rhizobium laguerreae]MBY3266874.1 carbohydrate ABC transporter permease [Rhizobium laguerreae]MBY3342028.1 carbohydrate ABC transporter permease [Rhizobium laguerreae]